MIRFRLASAGDSSDSADGDTLSVPWQKPPSRKSRQILIPHGVPRNEVRPTRIERRARLVNAIARGLDRRSADRGASKMQCAAGQYDDLARIPRAGSRQSRGRRSPSPRHRCRATARCSPRMEPAVRSPRTESAIIPDTAKILCIENLQFSEPPTVITARKIQPPGTEFLDAETGR
jgi:hypothetical protein